MTLSYMPTSIKLGLLPGKVTRSIDKTRIVAGRGTLKEDTQTQPRTTIRPLLSPRQRHPPYSTHMYKTLAFVA